MRYDPEHKQKTRERVLKAAARAIRAEGPDKVNVAAVMAQAGLTHGGFYGHFASKDDLTGAAIGQMLEESYERQRKSMGDRPPIEALNTYIDFYLSTEYHEARFAGCPLPFLSADAPRLSPEARACYASGATTLTDRIAEQFTKLGRTDAAADAASMLAEMLGAVSLARAEPSAERSTAILDHSRVSLRRRFDLDAAP